MNIVSIIVSPRKGEEILTLWAITQSRPYPRIKVSGWWHWEGAGGLLPDNGRTTAEGLARDYTAVMLRHDFNPDLAEDNRKDHAGYEGAPSIKFRGNDLGEIRATIRIGEGYKDGAACWFERGYGAKFSPGEAKFLEEQVKPGLVDYIRRNADALKAEAVAGIRASVNKVLHEAKEELEKLEKEMVEAIRAL